MLVVFIVILILTLLGLCEGYRCSSSSISLIQHRNRSFHDNKKYSKGLTIAMSSSSSSSSPSSSSSSSSSSLSLPFLSKQRLELIGNLSLWYLISAFYNIYNKKALNILKLPYFIATIQMLAGCLIFIPLWLLNIREFPFKDVNELVDTVYSLKNVILFNTLTHMSGVIALGSGAVSFTQVVKASEPAFTALISAIFQNSYLNSKAYYSLLMVIIGVAISSANELTFSWYCLGAGIIANIFASFRGVYSKTALCGDEKCQMILSAENFYAVITFFSCFLLVPLMFIMEYNPIMTLAKSSSALDREGLYYTLASGILFYLYNEVSFKVLDKVHPVTHALANTFKRVVIILSSIWFFKTPLTIGGSIGSVLAVVGVTLYSLVTTKKADQ
jgi:solute carrier family 35 protein E1